MEAGTKHRSPEDDEDPGVNDGVHRKKTEGSEVGVLVVIGVRSADVGTDLDG